ncbi:uncharacterized protein KY384_001631 [Bacidia gigantensis]|uniref:uncharacterized protein n=1 Tax=Bacidia gigantensis TaxID=2732470 RepID=UPI001D04C3B7|nr:uncharacterized protein KY384_001631 [Bacidia gigantensis]KAG8533890.1 hypothetical protein KY384_001631 [Bacidia gigantensis]
MRPLPRNEDPPLPLFFNDDIFPLHPQTMDLLARDYHAALSAQNGHLLAATISPIAPARYLNRLESIYHSTNHASVSQDVSYALTKNFSRSISQEDRQTIEAWSDIYVAYWHAVGALLAAEEDADDGRVWSKVYDTWKDVVNAVIRGYSSGLFENWTLPVLYLVGKHLRVFGIKADATKSSADGQTAVDMGGIQDDIAGDFGKNEKLEDAARVLNRMFTLCISDRAPLPESRKWGLYHAANLLFKTYFRLNSISLCKNILRAISASSTDMPPDSQFPKSHICTFKYYVGVIQFLSEDYTAAEENLLAALALCHHSARRNKALILTYLIPTRLLTNRSLPTARLLRTYPELEGLFVPLIGAIKLGSLADFDRALSAGERAFVKRRVYLTLERGRDLCLRNLLRQVYLQAGEDAEGKKRTRIRVDEFGAAVKFSEGFGGAGADVQMRDALGLGEMGNDEVECLLANMIYKVSQSPWSSRLCLFFTLLLSRRIGKGVDEKQNLMKGYISRAHGMVVLSKAGAFPGTGV